VLARTTVDAAGGGEARHRLAPVTGPSERGEFRWRRYGKGWRSSRYAMTRLAGIA
jgi:hypothetical protein